MFVNRSESTKLFWSNQDLEGGMTVMVQTLNWYGVGTVIRTASDCEVLVRVPVPHNYDGTPLAPQSDKGRTELDPHGEYWVTAQTITQVLTPPRDWTEGKPDWVRKGTAAGLTY